MLVYLLDMELREGVPIGQNVVLCGINVHIGTEKYKIDGLNVGRMPLLMWVVLSCIITDIKSFKRKSLFLPSYLLIECMYTANNAVAAFLFW